MPCSPTSSPSVSSSGATRMPTEALTTTKSTREVRNAKTEMENVPRIWTPTLISELKIPTRDRAPDATDTMNRNRTDRIVDPEAIEEKDGEDDEDTGDEADKNSRPYADRVGAGGDADQAGENAIERHGEVRLLEQEPARDDGGEPAGCSRKRRGHEDEGHQGRIRTEHGAPIEPEPTKEQQEDTDGGQRHAVAEDRPHFPTRQIFAKARSEDDDARQGREATEGVHERMNPRNHRNRDRRAIHLPISNNR